MKINGVYQSYFVNTKAIAQNSPISLATNPIKKQQQQVRKYAPLNNVSYIYFTGANKALHTPFLKSTADRIEQIYDNYSKNLNEVPLEEVHKTSEELQEKLNLPKETVLSAMAELTQFSGIKSVMKIGEAFDKSEISSIGNEDNKLYYNSGLKSEIRQSKPLRNIITNDSGLHKTLQYLLNEKGIHQTNKNLIHEKTAIILDDTRLSYYEKLKKNNPELLKKALKTPNVQYFVISGWDTGIPFINRTKDLKTETEKLLTKSIKTGKEPTELIDEDITERAKNVGINNITVIKNPVEKTEQGIYESMAPLKMNKTELYNMIDANSQVRVKGDENQLIAKDIASKYLEDGLVVYTPEKISKDLKSMYTKITDFAKDKQIPEKDILYVLPEETKSYDYITYSYQKINNIPNKNIVTSEDLLFDSKLSKDKMLVYLDDCTISGASISELAITDMDRNSFRNAKSIVFACVDGTKDAKDYFKFMENDSDKYKLLILNTTNKSKMFDDDKHLITLLKTVGNNGFEDGQYGHIFPYMSPDNDCELASNIALLHNINYRQSKNDYGSVYIRAIKTVSGKMQDVMNIFNNLGKNKEHSRIINKNMDTSKYINNWD